MTRLLFIFVLLISPILVFPQKTEYKITQRNIPEQYKDIHIFLEALKWNPKDLDGYNKSQTPNWNIPLLISNLFSNGVLFIDPNDKLNKLFTTKQIEKELKIKAGKSYEIISHMSYIYSIPYKQYSELNFK